MHSDCTQMLPSSIQPLVWKAGQSRDALFSEQPLRVSNSILPSLDSVTRLQVRKVQQSGVEGDTVIGMYHHYDPKPINILNR